MCFDKETSKVLIYHEQQKEGGNKASKAVKGREQAQLRYFPQRAFKAQKVQTELQETVIPVIQFLNSCNSKTKLHTSPSHVC